MKKKSVILVENDLFKLEDMLLSIQSILFVATKQRLSNAPGAGDTTISVLHLLGNNEEEDSKTFDGFKTILETRQRELMTSDYGCELNYSYKAVHIDRESYPPQNWDEGMEEVCRKLEEISNECDYSIVLDVILDDDKDPNLVLEGEKILSQFLWEKFSDHCIPYTKYDRSGQEFRKKWAEGIKTDKLPYERFRLDGNVIEKNFKREIYGHLKIGDRGGNNEKYN